MTRDTPFLRTVLLLDALASGATGFLLIAGAGLLEPWLALPATLMRTAGIILIPYVAFVAFAGTRETISRTAVGVIIAINVLWTLASFGLLASGQVAPSALGTAFVAAQAIVVAALGVLQYVGLQRPAVAA